MLSCSEKEKENIYKTLGTLLIEDTEFAVDVDYVQEVINAPSSYTPMPLSHDYVVGLLNLRGIVVPVIDLSVLLNLRVREENETRASKVAIINYGNANVGFLVDATGEVIKVKEDIFSKFNYDENSTNKVVLGALKLDDGKRLLQVLDPDSLIHIHNLPQIKRKEGAGYNLHSNHHFNKVRSKCISFLVNGVKLAFEITGIHEIVKLTKLQTSPSVSNYSIGIMNLRDEILPIVDFGLLLQSKTCSEDINNTDKRVVVLKLHDNYIGFLVDSIGSIHYFYEDDISPIPLLVDKRMNMFIGALTLDSASGDTLLLDPKQVLENDEVQQISLGSSKLFRKEVKSTEKKKTLSGKNRRSFISFSLSDKYGVAAEHVKEIVSYSSDLIPAPGTPDSIAGMLNLRKSLIPLISARAIYGMDNLEDVSGQKILIIDYHEITFGLIVDDILSIDHMSEESAMDLPPLLYNNVSSSIKTDIVEAYLLDGTINKPLLIINTEKLLERITSIASNLLPPAKEQKDTVVIESNRDIGQIMNPSSEELIDDINPASLSTLDEIGKLPLE